MVAKMIREANIKMINISQIKFEKRCNEADEEEKFLMLVQQI